MSCSILINLSKSNRYCQILFNIVRFCQILSDIFRYCQIKLDIVRYCQILLDFVINYQLLSNIFRYHYVYTDTVRYCTGCPTKKFTSFEQQFLGPLKSLRNCSILKTNLWISPFKRIMPWSYWMLIARDSRILRKYLRFL